MFNKTTFFKSVLYRVYSSSITFIVSFFLTGKLLVAFSISLIDMGVKVFSYYFFDSIWYRIMGFKVKPAVIWLTGLSGSGKTTIANNLMEKLKKKSVVPVLLDSAEIRHVIKEHGFDEESRKKHNLNVGYISSLFEKQGNLVVVSSISPYDDIRNEVRKMCNNFIEVYVSTNLDVCMERDRKGLYKKAKDGVIKNFTGINAPYYPPENPELILDTSKQSVDECSKVIIDFLRRGK